MVFYRLLKNREKLSIVSGMFLVLLVIMGINGALNYLFLQRCPWKIENQSSNFMIEAVKIHRIE